MQSNANGGRMEQGAIEVKDVTPVSRAAFERLHAADAWICFACRSVSVNATPGNARDDRERRCNASACRQEACVPVAQAAREGWLEVAP